MRTDARFTFDPRAMRDPADQARAAWDTPVDWGCIDAPDYLPCGGLYAGPLMRSGRQLGLGHCRHRDQL